MVRTTRFALPLIAGMLLAPSLSHADAGAETRIAAECGAMKVAYELTKSMAGKDRPWIENGCPGHTDAKNPREGSGWVTMGVLGGGVPKSVKRYGKWGKLIYQRMLFQGVPAEVAKAVADTPEFARAVAAYQQTTGEN